MIKAEEITKSASELIERTKEDLSAEGWLNKARNLEAKNHYKEAIDAYLEFLEIKLRIIQTRPEFGVNSYLGLVKYYVKIAKCYESIRHINLEDRSIDQENAAKYYIKAAGMFRELDDYADVQKYYETAARIYDETKKYDKAAECYLEIAGMYNGLNDKVLAISAYVNAVKFYEIVPDYEKSMGIWLNIADLNLDTGNILGTSSGYKKAGDSCWKTGKYQDALGYYIKSAEIIAGAGHYSEIAEIYNGIALSYEGLKEYENAIHYYLKSADLNIKGNEGKAGSSYGNIAICYEKLGGYEDAIEYYLKSCSIELKLKNYKNLASCYKGMAKSYEELKEYKKSADTYFQSAEYASIADGNINNAKEYYKKSAEIYNGIAEEELNNKDYNGAIEIYKKIAECYDRINEYGRSAEVYRKYADIMKDMDFAYEDVIRAYSESAGRYAKSRDMKQAGYYYAKAKDYANSAKSYIEYGRLNKHDQFLVAEGYRLAAHSYKKLKRTEDAKEYYNKAIGQYMQYMEKEYMPEKTGKWGVYKKIAECYNELGDMPNTKKNLEEALKSYNGADMGKEVIPVNALLLKTNAKLAIKTGDYAIAYKLLNEALDFFDKSMKNGNFDEEYYNEFLEENKNEVLSLLSQIKLKPTLFLNVEPPVQPITQGMFEIKGVITNNGSQNIHGVLILPTIPPGFQILKSPGGIESLKSNESRDISIQLNTPPSGEFRFAPLEVLYKDMAGNKYMKASNEISIKIQGLPEEYKEEKSVVEWGYSYIVEEVIPERCISIFADIIGKGAKGLYISKEHPDNIKDKFPSNTSAIWLSSSQKHDGVVNPTDLIELGHIVREFIDKNRNSTILLDGIEYLITQNGYADILKFIQSVNDAIASSDSSFIIAINPKALNLQQLTLLERECKVL